MWVWLDPSPGRAEGPGDAQGRDPQAVWLLQGSPGAKQFVSWEAISRLHANLEGCFGEAGNPGSAPFGLSVVEQVQPIQPRATDARVWLDPSLGREEGLG